MTERANRARWSAAWPAELPPPTTKTSRSSISRRRADGGAVVHAEPDQLLDRVDAEPAVGDARGDHDRAGAHLAAVGDDAVRVAVAPGTSASTGHPVKNRVPKRIAWLRARCERRMPEIPRGKPR